MERLRIDNIEIRKCTDDKHNFEVVAWSECDGREFCYVLAWINEGCESLWIETVGLRPWELSDKDQKIFNKIIKLYAELTE